MRRIRVLAVTAVLGVVAWGTPAHANHNHPSKANKFVATFVRSFNQCPGGSHTHGAPLAFPACDPSTVSQVASFGPKGLGQTVGVVLLNSTKQATDVKLVAKFVDVREGDDGTGAGYDGVLQASGVIRTTDHFCDGGANNPCTLIDVPFPVNVPCGSAASPALAAGKCAAKTSANAVLSGAVQPGHQANIGLGQLQVYASGELVFEEGLYLP